jgi:hypothetical protein
MHAPSISDILRYAVLLIIIIVVGLFVMSFLRKRRDHNALVDEMRSVVSDSGYYRQFYADDARKTLLRAMYLLHQAEQKGQDPSRFLNEVLGVAGDSWLDRTGDKPDSLSRTEALADSTLRANYENCRKLGLLDDAKSLETLAKGVPPTITIGPAAGKRATVYPIIDPALSPGIDKVLANLQIGPPRDTSQPLGDVEIAAARRLARTLQSAGIIDPAAQQRIETHLNKLSPK